LSYRRLLIELGKDLIQDKIGGFNYLSFPGNSSGTESRPFFGIPVCSSYETLKYSRKKRV